MSKRYIFEKYKSDVHRFSSDVHQFSSRENVPVFSTNLWRQDDVKRWFWRHDDVLMTLDCSTSFVYVVNVRNACDWLCYSQIFVAFVH